jgi:superfamily II DNA or RNA helicase
MNVEITSKLRITELPLKLAAEIKEKLTVRNPAYDDAEKMGRYTGDIQPLIECYRDEGGALIAPRGFLRQLHGIAKGYGESFTWTDKTRKLEPVSFEFKGVLRPYQQRAVDEVLSSRFGVLEAPTGSGKTVMALNIISERRQPALIVCHTKELLNQWVDRIHSFLGIPIDEIGIIGGGKQRIGGRVTVAMVQTLHKCKEDVFPRIGHLVVDECHRCPSRTFTEAVAAFDSQFMLGLSATPYRRDRLTKLIYLYLGDRVAAVDQGELTETGAILPFKVRWVKTDFETDLDASTKYSRMLSELTKDPERNRLICSETARQAKNGGGIPLVLSDRKAHCEAICEALERNHGIESSVLTGDLSAKIRADVVDRLRAGRCRALIATGQLIGEGFDLPALGSAILATPIRFKGRLIKSIGRALRPSPGQYHATVVDFVDIQVGVLEHSAKQRVKVYRGLGAA